MATNVATDQLLQANVVTRIVQREYAPSNRVLALFGMAPGGKNLETHMGRTFQYDIFNDFRMPSSFRAAGAPALHVKPQSVSSVAVTIARTHEMTSFPAERIRQYRGVGQSPGDYGNVNEYLARQASQLAVRGSTWRTTMLFGMLRDSLYMIRSGDNFYPTFTTGTGAEQINFRIPSDNKGVVAGIAAGAGGGGVWTTVSNDVYGDILRAQAKMMQETGLPLAYCVVNSVTWGYVSNNDGLRNRAGSVNPPFENYNREVGQDSNGKPILLATASLKALPWLRWIIVDEGANIGAPGSETFTKWIPDNVCVFMPDPDASAKWCQGYEGTEDVVEYEGGPMSPRTGVYSWTRMTANPAGYSLWHLDNFLPVLYTPRAIIYATVG